MVARCSEARSRPSVGPQRPPAHPLKALDEPDKSIAGVHRDLVSFAGSRPRKSGSRLRRTQALPRLASSAGLRLENHELGRARRDAARLRRSGGHYDDDKHVMVLAAPGFGGAASRAEWLFGASQVAAAFLQGIQRPQEGLQRQIASFFGQ